jgi:hypothetical protein
MTMDYVYGYCKTGEAMLLMAERLFVCEELDSIGLAFVFQNKQ